MMYNVIQYNKNILERLYNNAGENMEIAAQFAKFIVESKYKDIPDETVNFIKQLTLKCVAGMLAGSAVVSSKKMIKYVKERRELPEAGVIGCGFRTSVESAALANGYFAHASELEDDQFPGGGVSDITVWPALIPAAEKLKLSGKEFIEAVFVGTEVQNRLAYFASAGTDGMGIVGLPFFGIFGATAAAAKAYGLDYEETKSALGIAMTQGIGYMHDWGTDTHFFESAAVCRNGIIAALLAKEGMSSNPDFEGWLTTLVGEGKIELEKITEGLGKPPFFVHNIWVKKYPCCFFTHRYIDALDTLLKEQNIPYDKIEKVETQLGPLDKIVDRPDPKHPEDSKFSIQQTLAAIMLERDIRLDTFSEEKIENPRFKEARSKVKVSVREDWPRRYMSGIVRVDVLLKDGKKFSKEMEQSIGGPKLPLTKEQFESLYRKYSQAALSMDQIEQTMNIIQNLEKACDLLELMDTLTFRHAVRLPFK
ncbi:MAG: MmgE/PrpD family protein [Candidatus Bathyarchaeia archaeon]